MGKGLEVICTIKGRRELLSTVTIVTKEREKQKLLPPFEKVRRGGKGK